ncbi:MAG: tRNA (5-methylaminomethyl-2-thiouridine)(34)-methyltransferase MnmD [Flavobacteriales bacterium]
MQSHTPDKYVEFSPPTDLVILRTADGSFTLDSPTLGEHYHSLHGAVAESRHVYIQQGLRSTGKRKLDILEVGFGTGLNALLTWVECGQVGLQVDYLALEPYPLPPSLRMVAGHTTAINEPAKEHVFEAMMNLPDGEWLDLPDGFRFRRESQRVQELEAEEAFDLVYFDAFAPAIQPSMWSLEVFQRIHRAMRPGAMLVTYCAKGDVRRTMMQAGLKPERVQGPPGKYKMLHALRPE